MFVKPPTPKVMIYATSHSLFEYSTLADSAKRQEADNG